MSDTLSEFEGCTHLSRLFRRRGYTIERNVMFREYGVEFHIDGWEEKARVGFEYLTSEDDDHDDLDVEDPPERNKDPDGFSNHPSIHGSRPDA